MLELIVSVVMGVFLLGGLFVYDVITTNRSTRAALAECKELLSTYQSILDSKRKSMGLELVEPYVEIEELQKDHTDDEILEIIKMRNVNVDRM